MLVAVAPLVGLGSSNWRWKCQLFPRDVIVENENYQGAPCSEDPYCSSLCDAYTYQPWPAGNCVYTGNILHWCNRVDPFPVTRTARRGRCELPEVNPYGDCFCKVPDEATPNSTNIVANCWP
jgi:hypothetical protein